MHVKYLRFQYSTMHHKALKRRRAILGTISIISVILLSSNTMKYLNDFGHVSTLVKYHGSAGINLYVKGNLYGIGDHLAVSRVLQSNYTKAAGPDWNTISGPVIQLLKEKPPVFLPEFKNPCWYASDDDRRDVWINYLCSETRIQGGKFCSFYSKGERPKNATILRCLPYFLLIGQPKSGSTDLFRRIISHPDVRPGISKEPHWWTRHRHCPVLNRTEECNPRAPQTFTEYIDYFNYVAEILHVANDEQKMKVITGEGSQSTLWDHTWWWSYPENKNDTEPGIHNAQFLRHILPDVKILVIVRNPVDRLYSDYLYFKPREQKSVEVFDSAARQSVDLFNSCLRRNSLRHCAYMERIGDVRLTVGLYAVYLEDWMDVFPKQQILVVSLDEYSANQSIVASRIFKFLDLSDVHNKGSSRSTHYNTKRWYGRVAGDMLNETRLLLEQFYKPYNQALSLLLNDSRFLWGT